MEKDFINTKPAPTEGEIVIADFLKIIGIKFEEQIVLSELKDDIKKFRRVDFYLPEYKVYIEYFGLWQKGNIEYDQNTKFKIKVYKKNKIPCVYLYPENLGFLYHVLDQRMIKCLKENNLIRELVKYRNFKFKKTAGINFALLGFSILMIIGNIFESKENAIYLLFGVIAIYQCYRVYKLYDLIYKKDKYSLFNLYIEK